jgi:3D (Asp-Asp-Asp) domain-containing protein/LysM repeat protein
MKKLVAALAAGVIVSGAAVSSVSAESYDVKEGDSLWNIAEQYNTTVDELVEVNDLKTTTIQPKQEIVIDNEVETYVVEKGDTLGGISKDHNTTVTKLKDWNDLKSDLIITGQKLAVNGKQKADKESAPVTEAKAETKEAPKEEVKTEPKKEKKQEPKAEPKKETKQESKSEPKKEASNNKSEKSSKGETVSVTATAYTAKCEGCSGVTSTGVDLNANPNAKVIAVDPSVIPLGTKVHVEGYGDATAADIGGAIKGNKIDVHVPTEGEANNWGVKTVNVTILD